MKLHAIVKLYYIAMDDFFSDGFHDSDMPIGWTEKDWFAYLKKSESEISKFAAAYTVNRLRGKTLDEIAKMAGWQIPLEDSEPQAYQNCESEEMEADFSDEPWTLLNHPVYIITRALLKCLQEHLGRVIEETKAESTLVWNISKTIAETSMFMALAANSTDLSEDLLARCNYKMSSLKLNEILAKISQLPLPESEHGRERIRRINNIIFDLRQLCLNMAESYGIENNR